jgi:hypothetical protein
VLVLVLVLMLVLVFVLVFAPALEFLRVILPMPLPMPIPVPLLTRLSTQSALGVMRFNVRLTQGPGRTAKRAAPAAKDDYAQWDRRHAALATRSKSTCRRPYRLRPIVNQRARDPRRAQSRTLTVPHPAIPHSHLWP